MNSCRGWPFERTMVACRQKSGTRRNSAAYEAEMGGNAVFRMKEWWFYAQRAFTDPLTVHRAIRKARRADEYRAAVERVFREGRLADDPWFRG